jgi:hypothetical protein
MINEHRQFAKKKNSVWQFKNAEIDANSNEIVFKKFSQEKLETKNLEKSERNR